MSDDSATFVAMTIRRCAVRLEDPLLLADRQPGVERQDLASSGSAASPAIGASAEHLGRLVDVALGGHEDQDVAAVDPGQFVDRVAASPSPDRARPVFVGPAIGR